MPTIELKEGQVFEVFLPTFVGVVRSRSGNLTLYVGDCDADGFIETRSEVEEKTSRRKAKLDAGRKIDEN